jgi:hypothetical protein
MLECDEVWYFLIEGLGHPSKPTDGMYIELNFAKEAEIPMVRFSTVEGFLDHLETTKHPVKDVTIEKFIRENGG